MRPIIEAVRISKRYRRGEVGATTLREEVSGLLSRFAAGRPRRPLEVREFWALNDVSLKVERGEVVGIVGRNGAGKSTLLKIISRITQPTEGEVRIRGRVASLLEVGTGFHPELSGRENVFLNGAILGMTRAEVKGRFDEIVAFSGVAAFIDTPVKRYSSGMAVRLAFAVAAHLEAEILLIDEVLAVGDAEFQKKCIGKMQNVARGGRTVLFVSHSLPTIEALCTSGVLLADGRVTATGTAKAVVAQYLSGLTLSGQTLRTSAGKNIRSVTTSGADGQESDTFRLGEDIVFDIELFHEGRLEHPRFCIGIDTLRGERLVTIHTDIQQRQNWAFEGGKRIRAVWNRNALVPGRYSVFADFWGHSSEIETLQRVKEFEILPRDVYGTGVLPDISYQGYVVADAQWEMHR